MSPPLSLKNCPKSFQENPLPFDECAPANPAWRQPGQRFPWVSASFEYQYVYSSAGDNGNFMGAQLLVRPTLRFGLGAQFSTNFFSSQTQWLGRLQTSFNLQRHGMAKGTLALLAGVNHFSNQSRALQGPSQGEAAVDGTALTVGGEVAADLRIFTWLSASLFARGLYQPSTEMPLHEDPLQTSSFKGSRDLSGGIRLSFDFFEQGD